MSTDQAATTGATPNAAAIAGNSRFRIAHLSDLHFGASFDAELWGYVQGVLREHEPELLVITGDVVDTPSLFQMGLVRQELRCAANKLHCEYLLIPGNHDVAILGNVAIWPWSGKYRIVFSKQYDSCFKELCTFTEYRAFSRGKKIYYRALWWLKLTALRLAGKLRDPGEGAFRIMNDTIAGGRVLFACFNTNAKMWLATGRVAHEAIQSLDRELEGLSRDGKAGWLVPRIALAHHHAVAIPHSTTTESVTAFEPFLTMRNAGTLLNELGKLEFDVLLHGHKHFWNFARLSFDSPGRGASEMAIIAAGSATVKQTGAGRNSLNLIDLMPNGLIVHRPLFFGQGMTVAGKYEAALENARALLTLEQVKERAYRKAVKRLQSECDEVAREIRINPDGGADFILMVRGYRTLGTRRSRHARLHVIVSSGGINPRSVTLDTGENSCGHYLELAPNAMPTRHLVVPINLGSEVYEGREDAVDFGIRCRTMNSFAITKWEATMLPGPGSEEWAGVTVLQPARRLRLVVVIPDILRDLGVKPVLVCQRPATYPALSFNEYGEVGVPMGEDEWVTDQDFTTLETSRLRISEVYADTRSPIGSVRPPGLPECKEHSRICELVIEQPLVGFRYLIRWTVKQPFPECPIEIKGSAMQLRQALLDMQPNLAPQPTAATSDTLETVMEEIFNDVLRPTFRSPFKQDEGLVAAVFVYNEQKKALDLVLEAGPGKKLSGRCESIPINEGVVGRVFKTRKTALYLHPELAEKQDGLYLYYEPGREPKEEDELRALVALPLYIKQDDQPNGTDTRAISAIVPPEAMIGVFTLGSNAWDTGLLGLKTEEGRVGADEDEGKGEMLRTLAEQFVSGYISFFENGGLVENGTVADNVSESKEVNHETRSNN